MQCRGFCREGGGMRGGKRTEIGVHYDFSTTAMHEDNVNLAGDSQICDAISPVGGTRMHCSLFVHRFLRLTQVLEGRFSY